MVITRNSSVSVKPPLQVSNFDEFWKQVEADQEDLRLLEEERDRAPVKAESSSKRSRHLTDAAKNLYESAFREVQRGNEEGAKKLLKDKAIVMAALEGAHARAETNLALAAKLEQKIGMKQLELLKMIETEGKSFVRPSSEPSGQPAVESSGKRAWQSETIKPANRPSNEEIPTQEDEDHDE